MGNPIEPYPRLFKQMKLIKQAKSELQKSSETAYSAEQAYMKSCPPLLDTRLLMVKLGCGCQGGSGPELTSSPTTTCQTDQEGVETVVGWSETHISPSSSLTTLLSAPQPMATTALFSANNRRMALLINNKLQI